MNKDYLIDHLEEEYHTSVYRFSMDDGKLLSKTGLLVDDVDNESVLRLMFDDSYFQYPQIMTFDQDLFFCTIPLQEEKWVLGPFKQKNHLNNKQEYKIDQLEILENILNHAVTVNVLKLCQELVHLYNLFQPEVITVQEMLERSAIGDLKPENRLEDLLNDQFEHHDEQRQHNPYRQELREIQSIENGDMQRLEQSWEESYEGQLGVLGPTKLRSAKNTGIVVITLASRAAIHVGVHYEIAYSLSDQFINLIEQATSPKRVLEICREAETEYTTRVNQLRTTKKTNEIADYQHPLVEKAKRYIYANLHQNIVIRDVAQYVGVHPNYLSRLFRDEEGETIQTIILNEKMQYAEQLLIYSAKPISEITTSIGFASQSYFGSVFKKQRGYSPKEYRKKYGRY